MKSLKLKTFFTASALILSLLAGASLSFAQTTYIWSNDGINLGGTGTWDNANQRWGTSIAGPFTTIWPNNTSPTDIAQFQGPAGTVTIDPSVTHVRRINVFTSGYVIDGSTATLTSNQVNNSFWIQSTQLNTATVNTNVNFDTGTTANYNVRIRTEAATNTAVLNLGGDYDFTAGPLGTKRLDLETNTDTFTHTINFSGSLLGFSFTDTRLRIGNGGGAASTFNISGASAYMGGTEIIRGTVNLSDPNGFGTGQITFLSNPSTTAARVNIAGAINITNPWQLAGSSVAGSIIGKSATDNTTSILSGNVNLNSDNNLVTFDVGHPDGEINVSGLITDGAGTRSIRKTGPGTLRLSRSVGNSYDGGTIVDGGTLLVTNTTNSATGTGTVTIASGATLAGTGRIGGSVTVSGSIAPGDAGIGTLTVNNNVTWNAGNPWVFELGAPGPSLALPGTSDLLNITGGNNFLRGTGSGFTFDFANTGAVGWYRLVDWDGITDFTAADFVATNLAPSLTATFFIDPATSALYIEVIPEPSLVTVLALALAALVILRHRLLQAKKADNSLLTVASANS